MLSDEKPFVIFDQKGKKIDKDEMFDVEQVIFILDSTFKIEPSEIIKSEELDQFIKR